MTAAFVYRFLSVKSRCNLIAYGQLFEFSYKTILQTVCLPLDKNMIYVRANIFLHSNNYFDSRKQACYFVLLCSDVVHFLVCIPAHLAIILKISFSVAHIMIIAIGIII